jgi:hypothetical protein
MANIEKLDGSDDDGITPLMTVISAPSTPIHGHEAQFFQNATI